MVDGPMDIMSRMIGRTTAHDGGELYSPTHHVMKTASAKGFSLVAVLKAANDPSTAYPSRKVEGQMRHVRGDLVAVVDPASRKVITAYKNVEQTPLRPDQTDADALKYGKQFRGK